MSRAIHVLLLLAGCIFLSGACNRDPEQYVQLVRVKVGDHVIYSDQTNEDVPSDEPVTIEFNNALDTLTAGENLLLSGQNGTATSASVSYSGDSKIVTLTPLEDLAPLTAYSLSILDGLTGAAGEIFPGASYQFTTTNGTLKILSVTLNEHPFTEGTELQGISYENMNIDIHFSGALDPNTYSTFMTLTGNAPLSFELSNDSTGVTITNTGNLEDNKRHFFNISANLTAANGYAFKGYSASFFTALDSSYKFPEIPDDELLELIQQQTFKYFYDFAHPVSGLARERNSSGEVVTTGGSGFGLMAVVAGIERNFITREEGLVHFDKVVNFLESCDRFHGVWPHWLNGSTGKVYPFSEKDNGADLVETAFLVQGLLTVRQYLSPADTEEKELIDRINLLWETVEWDWFTRSGESVLYWHWSPNYGWEMNMPIRGYNEALIVYVLASASPAHTIDPAVYHEGWARSGAITNGNDFYGITLPLGYDYGGPLFFAHYSFLGLDPRNLSDQYGDYWEQNVNHTLINRMHAINNPNGYVGYSSDCWGFTASDGNEGYSAHSPTNDRGVITPTAAISSIPFTPEASMDAIRHFYYRLGDRLWGEYGFYDAFNTTAGWYAGSYIAIDQGPEVVMIENYRSGLLWDLFMSAPEISTGLSKLGFTFEK
ncbi:MAG: Ig-like domain-containing protein [Bacteroidales bacterium]|nr:Ig-like domain-containing protein [Bacteroidales bacterium]